MPGFYGYRSVIADWRKQLRTGKVVSGTLKARLTTSSPDTFTDVSWANLYIWPQTETTGYSGTGYANVDGMITLYRLGETTAPRVDDLIVVSGTTYVISHIKTRLNADESNNFAVYDCTVSS